MKPAFVIFLLSAIALSSGSSLNPKCPVVQHNTNDCAIVPDNPVPGQVSGISAFEYDRRARNGPSQWHKLDCSTGKYAKFRGCSYCKNTCLGKSQSPIDIIRVQAEKAPTSKSPRVHLSHHANLIYETTPGNFELLCMKKHHCGSTVYKHKKYHVENVHMHHYSEHLLDAKQYPMEMHFVHKHKEDVLVLAVFFNVGSFNPELEDFLEMSRRKCHGKINLHKLVAPAVKHNKLMTYSGSLTTPPCTEGIQFVVSQEVLQASNSQIAEFNDLIANGIDSRPRQPLNGRKVTLFA